MAQVMFFDVSDPMNPVKLPSVIDRPGKTAGAVGIVRQANGKWLAMVGDGDNNNIDLYVEGDDGSFSLVASWGKQELLKDAGVEGGYKSYQNMNVLLQSDGQIFMVCTALSSMFMGSDYFDLFSVLPSGNGRATITMVGSKKARSTSLPLCIMFYMLYTVYTDIVYSILYIHISIYTRIICSQIRGKAHPQR